MANYIKKSLEEGENIVYMGRMHWTCIWSYLAWSYILLALSVALAGAGYYVEAQDQNIYYILAGASLVIAAVVWCCGYILRTRTEFAITDTRFIQKDGILNIKMTEIPLQRIETVNFYQNFFQRIFGTGCIELVGSGGTSHQVHFIERPMEVRKIIVGAINKPRTEQPVQSSNALETKA